jgi:tRNA(Ile)-lysidine synthetase-like protein
MEVALKSGKYVAAVSGGVDSMVLLDVLAGQKGFELVVAHFDHGIREDSGLDRQAVAAAAKSYRLAFVSEKGHLGPRASEATARQARYAFLRQVLKEQDAAAIITAHHQDDVIETAVLNMLRGTRRKGLSSLQSQGDIIRPFLHLSKKDILDYAHGHPAVFWREDSTNLSDRYLRNYIRHHVLQNVDAEGRARLLKHIKKAGETNAVIDDLLLADINQHTTAAGLDRQWFALLPYDVSCELMAAWLRASGVREFDRRLVARLVIAAKVDKPGSLRDINAAFWLKANKTTLQLVQRSVSQKQRERV